MSRRWALCAVLLLLQGCLTPFEREPAELPEELNVVPNEGPFDPSKAVDDTGKGELEKTNEQPQVAQDQEVGKKEDVATEEVAEARKERSERAAKNANESEGEDDVAKAQVAKDLPPQDPGSGEPGWKTAVDWALELVIVVVLALVLTVPVWLLVRGLHRLRASLGHGHGHRGHRDRHETARRFREA